MNDAIQVEVREHPSSKPADPSWTAIVTVRGRCHYAVYAGDRPSDEKVRRDWEEDRNTSRAANWAPYYS